MEQTHKWCSMRGYHFNFVILDNVKLPQPFPFSQFQRWDGFCCTRFTHHPVFTCLRFSFDYLDLLNLSSLQFTDNFNDKGRDYYYGRSNRGSPPDLSASGSSRSSHKVNDTSYYMSASSSPSSSSSPSLSEGHVAADARKQQNSRSRRRRRK